MTTARRTAPPRHHEVLRRRLAVAVTALPVGLGAATSWLGAFATWTDSVQATSSFVSGSVDLTVDGSNGPTYTWSGLTVSGMGPGSVAYAGLTVANPGSVPLTYGMTTSAGGSAALASALTIGVRQVAVPGCSSGAYSGGTVLSADATGLTSATVSARTLAAGGQELLCVKVTLPAGASPSLKGTSTTPAFAFTATT